MGFASIRLDQLTHPTVPIGQPGRARDDLVLGQPITARNSNDVDVARWVWALVDKPLGSLTVLSGTTSPQVVFTPDVAGSYLLRLSVDDGVTGQIDHKVAAVRDSVGHRYPATGEDANSTNWPGNENKGWGKDAEQILRGLASPQLIAGVMPENVPIAASTVITIGGIGLPASLAQIVDAGFVDVAASIGPAPTINSYAFLTVPGTNGKELIAFTIDLDTSASVVADAWAIIIGLADVGDVLVSKITIA